MRKDYTGKVVYIGIDVHKKSYVVYALCDGKKVKSWTTPALPAQLASQLLEYFKGATINSAYEAGFCGFILHRELMSHGIKNRVVNPGSIAVASRDRVKTDKRDAEKLAKQLSWGELESIYIPSEKEELSRLLVRLRASYVKDRARYANRIKSKLMQFGYHAPDADSTTSKSWVESIKSGDYPEALAYVLNKYCEHWLSLTEEIKELDKKIAQESKADESLQAKEIIYQSAPGIGDISARELSRELGDLQHFSNERQIYSYVGLTPSEHSSGESTRRGHISRCGRPRLRGLLIQIAWRALAKEADLKQRFERLANRRGKKRAIVAIARILIGRLRACFAGGEVYELDPEKRVSNTTVKS